MVWDYSLAPLAALAVQRLYELVWQAGVSQLGFQHRDSLIIAGSFPTDRAIAQQVNTYAE
jgi:hypothetical protein